MVDIDIQQILDTLELAFQKIGKLQTDVYILQSIEENSAAEPALPMLPCKYIFFPVEVTSIVTASGGFWGAIQKPTASNTYSPWEHDTDLNDIFVNVRTADEYPDIGNTVRADFIGNHSNIRGTTYALLSPIPRRYRPFELNAELSGGGSASVKWLTWSSSTSAYEETGDSGTVYSGISPSWGLEGERGEAFEREEDVWQVSNNPGNPVYFGTFQDDITSSPVTVIVSIADGSTTVSAVLKQPPPTGQKYESGTKCYVSYTDDTFHIISVLACPVEIEEEE